MPQGSLTQHQPSLLEKETVSVKSISNWKFNQFLPTGNHLRNVIGKEVEWYADDSENSIGTIAFSKKQRVWNCAILRRDWMGDFQVCDLKTNLPNFRAACADCMSAKAAEKSDQRSFRNIRAVTETVSVSLIALPRKSVVKAPSSTPCLNTELTSKRGRLIMGINPEIRSQTVVAEAC
jgi:hypothetical protein